MAESFLGIEIQKDEDANFFIEASQWLGTPYRYGGTSKKGADCSGFVNAFYKDYYKIDLQRSSSSIFYQNCSAISRKSLSTGDLIFFAFGKSKSINHVGIYLKNDRFIHSTTSKGVVVSSLNDPYYKKGYKESGRVVSY
ncbi:MAG: NlpC/P60 family protein [Bacteroidales bacterium]|nr:NlpC/P60 family protein [Bacteroidales bacterium]